MDIMRKGNVGWTKPKNLWKQGWEGKTERDMINISALGEQSERLPICVYIGCPIAQSRMLAGQFPGHLSYPSLHLYEMSR